MKGDYCRGQSQAGAVRRSQRRADRDSAGARRRCDRVDDAGELTPWNLGGRRRSHVSRRSAAVGISMTWPKGRYETGPNYNLMDWVRRLDEYGAA
jgi:hypothetical protein